MENKGIFKKVLIVVGIALVAYLLYYVMQNMGADSMSSEGGH